MQRDKFHGRHSAKGRTCEWTDCVNEGEFRAPGARPPGFDGPGDYRWYCLDHVREFNKSYDFFAGMSADEVCEAQSPLYGWQSDVRAFRPTAGIDDAPRWADFADPLEAIASRARRTKTDMQARAIALPRMSAALWAYWGWGRILIAQSFAAVMQNYCISITLTAMAVTGRMNNALLRLSMLINC